MDERPRLPPEPKAGGALIAIALLVGAVIGVVFHQPTIGLLTGAGLGTIAALILWWRDHAQR